MAWAATGIQCFRDFIFKLSNAVFYTIEAGTNILENEQDLVVGCRRAFGVNVGIIAFTFI